MEEIKVYDKDDQQITLLVQWDLDVYIYIKEDCITSAQNVHFFNSESDVAYVTESTYSDGVLCTKIPNRLLFVALPITGYIYATDDNYSYRNEYVFNIPVRARTIPSDFAYVNDDSDDYINTEKVLAECIGYAESAQASAEEAENWTNLSKSWAVGDTGVRSGEDTDNSKYYAKQAATSESNAATSETNAKTSETNAKTSETNAKTSETNAADSATLSESYAVGGTGTRSGEDFDNAKYYSELCKEYAESFETELRIMGSVEFKSLPPRTSAEPGDMYNIIDSFITTDDFVEGEGYVAKMGSNVYLTHDGYWDVIGGVDEITETNGTTQAWLIDENGNIILVDDDNGIIVEYDLSNSGIISDAFDENHDYSKGDYCIYKNVLYRFTQDKSAGSWDNGYVESTTVLAEFQSLTDAINDIYTKLENVISTGLAEDTEEDNYDDSVTTSPQSTDNTEIIMPDDDKGADNNDKNNDEDKEDNGEEDSYIAGGEEDIIISDLDNEDKDDSSDKELENTSED